METYLSKLIRFISEIDFPRITFENVSLLFSAEIASVDKLVSTCENTKLMQKIDTTVNLLATSDPEGDLPFGQEKQEGEISSCAKKNKNTNSDFVNFSTFWIISTCFHQFQRLNFKNFGATRHIPYYSHIPLFCNPPVSVPATKIQQKSGKN